MVLLRKLNFEQMEYDERMKNTNANTNECVCIAFILPEDYLCSFIIYV